MGFFSKLFGGGVKEEASGGQTQALRSFFDKKLPKSYVSSPKYAVAITYGDRGYAATVTLDMQADGSDYSDFGAEEYNDMSELESSYVFDKLTDPPITVTVTFLMDFGKTQIKKDMGRILSK